MAKIQILFHICIILILVGSIFGVAFGIIYPSCNFKEGYCILENYTVSNYTFCKQSCNTTIPSCNTLLEANTSGQCYNDSISDNIYERCYIICDTYYTVEGFYDKGKIIVNCRNNQTCINKIISETNITCYYKGNIIAITNPGIMWEFIIVIIILILLLAFYVVINLTVFRKHLFD